MTTVSNVLGYIIARQYLLPNVEFITKEFLDFSWENPCIS